MNLPAFIEEMILKEIQLAGLSKATIHTHNQRLAEIRRQLYSLSKDFARSRSSEDQYADAYRAFNFPLSFIKAWYIGRQILKLCKTAAHKEKVSILDLGCGEGAVMYGLLAAFYRLPRLSLTGIDASSGMLTTCRRLAGVLKKHYGNFDLRTRHHDITDGFVRNKKKYDFVIIANALTEIFPKQAIPGYFVERLLKHIADEGYLVMIEPGTREHSRKLMNVRRAIVSKGKYDVLLPCLHNDKCPLMHIRKEREWCHQSIEWHPPEYLRILNQGLNREIDVLKFSYFVIGKSPAACKNPDQYLLISQLLKDKGRKKCFLCNCNGRIELLRLNRHRNTKNKIFDTLKKGDIISLEHYQKKSPRTWRVTQDTRLKIVNR